jgi:hypothetical protein
MSRSLVVSLALLLAVGGALLIHLQSDRGGGRSVTTPQVREAPGGNATDLAELSGDDGAGAPTDVEVMSASSVDDAGERAAVRATWVVRGTVGRGTEQPASGVRIRVRLYAGPSPSGEPTLEQHVESDAAGRFRCSLEAPDVLSVIEAEPVVENAYVYGDWERVRPDGEPPLELRCLVYPLDTQVIGQVRGTDGAPLSGATVKARTGEATTDVDGRYRLPSSSFRRSDRVHAWAEGYAEGRLTVQRAEPGGTSQVDFDLRRELRVVGRVVDDRDVPLAGAVITTFFTRYAQATSGPDGRFVLEHLDPGRDSHHVYARLEGFVEGSESVQPGTASAVELTLVLRRGTPVHGLVRRPDGTPADGAELFIGFSPAAYDRLDALAGDDGAFEFACVAPGEQTLWTEREGYAPERRVIQVPEAGTPMAPIVIDLARGRYVAGRALGENGEVLERTWVSPRQDDEYIGGRVRLDEQGRFRVEGLPDTGVSLEFWGASIVRTTIEVAELDVDDLEVRLPRAGTVAGMVVDGETGEPLERFRIRLVNGSPRDGERRARGISASWVREGHVFDGTDGRWEAAGLELEPGTVVGVEVTAEGYAPTRLDRVVVAVELDPEASVARMARGITVRGRVIEEESGAPVAGASVHRVAAQLRQPWLLGSTHDKVFVHTDANGRFELAGVPAGSMSLRVEHDVYPTVVDGPFEVDAERGVPDRVITVGVGGSIAGVVLDEDGRPEAGVEVSAISMERRGPGRSSEQVRSTSDGGFRFGQLAPGRYQLSTMAIAFGRGYSPLSARVQVARGATTEVRLGPDGTGALRGTLERTAGADGVVRVMAARTVDGTEAGTALTRVLPVEGDAFELRGLAAGEYYVAASLRVEESGAMLGAEARVTLGNGATADVHLRLVER